MKSPFLSSRIRSLRADKLLLAFLVCVFLVMLLLNFLTPLCADDYAYAFSFADGSRITNPLMIIPSMAAHRHMLNGRVFPHLLMQFFIMLPKAFFNFFNALNVVFLFSLVYLLIYSGAAHAPCARSLPVKYSLLVFCAAALIWCFTPAFGSVYFWVAGSCNYSWALSVSLIYLLPFCAAFLDEDLSVSRPVQLLFLLHSFVVGAYSENNGCTAIFLSFLLLLLVSVRRRKVSPFLLLCVAMACLGLLYLVSAPAEHGRIDLSAAEIISRFRSVTDTCLTQLLPMLLLYGALFALSLACGVDRRRVLLSFLFFCGALLSGYVFIFALYVPARGLGSMVFYLALSSMILASGLWDIGQEKLLAVLSGLLAVVFVFNFILGALDILYLSRSVAAREQLMAQAKLDGITKIGFAPYTSFSQYSVLTDSNRDITPDPNDWLTSAYADYYGFEAVWLDGDLIK